MDRRGIWRFVLLGVVMLLAGCGNHTAANTENTIESTALGNAESGTEDDAGHAAEDTAEQGTDTDAAGIPDSLPQNAVAYKAKSTYYEDGEVSVVWMRSYDERDNMLSEEKLDPITGEGMGALFGEHAYLYDEDGQIQAEFFGSLEEYDTYEYNEDGTVRTYCSYADGALKQKKEYVYDAYGNETKVTEVNGEDAIASEQVTDYRYDADGNMIESIRYDEAGEISFRCGFEYDEKNQVIKSYIYQGEGTEYLSYFAYTYDDNGNMLREDAYGKETASDAFELGSSMVYEYDARNRRTREEHYKDGVLQTYTITEYEDIVN